MVNLVGIDPTAGKVIIRSEKEGALTFPVGDVPRFGGVIRIINLEINLIAVVGGIIEDHRMVDGELGKEDDMHHDWVMRFQMCQQVIRRSVLLGATIRKDN